MKFREHRGALSAALSTTVELPATRAALAEYCTKLLRPFNYPCGAADLCIEPYGYDERIDWDTHIVTLQGYGVLGFTDGPVS